MRPCPPVPLARRAPWPPHPSLRTDGSWAGVSASAPPAAGFPPEGRKEAWLRGPPSARRAGVSGPCLAAVRLATASQPNRGLPVVAGPCWASRPRRRPVGGRLGTSDLPASAPSRPVGAGFSVLPSDLTLGGGFSSEWARVEEKRGCLGALGVPPFTPTEPLWRSQQALGFPPVAPFRVSPTDGCGS